MRRRRRHISSMKSGLKTFFVLFLLCLALALTLFSCVRGCHDVSRMGEKYMDEVIQKGMGSLKEGAREGVQRKAP